MFFSSAKEKKKEKAWMRDDKGERDQELISFRSQQNIYVAINKIFQRSLDWSQKP